MASHSLAKTELRPITAAELDVVPDRTILNRWKKELGFDWELAVGQVLKDISKNTKVKVIDRAKILIQGAAAIKTIKSEKVNSPQQAVQVNVITVDQLKKPSNGQPETTP